MFRCLCGHKRKCDTHVTEEDLVGKLTTCSCWIDIDGHKQRTSTNQVQAHQYVGPWAVRSGGH